VISSSKLYKFGHLITFKLSSETYTFCYSQVLSLLRNNELLGFVDGTTLCLVVTNSVPRDVKNAKLEEPPLIIPNPSYNTWHKKDKAIMSAILSSCTIDISGIC
jgi:hypothetical protein